MWGGCSGAERRGARACHPYRALLLVRGVLAVVRAASDAAARAPGAPPPHPHPRPAWRVRACAQVTLSALGVAVAACVTVGEVLKNKGLAVTKSVRTSSVLLEQAADGDDDEGDEGGSAQGAGGEERYRKAKIEVVLARSEQFFQLVEKQGAGLPAGGHGTATAMDQ